MSLKKDLRDLCSEARAAGFDVSQTKNGHVLFLSPEPGSPPIYGASTPSDRRAVLNLRAKLRQHGLPRAA